MDNICIKWMENKNINPITNYKIKTNEYFANTVVNKNLTSIINREERIKYLIKAKDNIKKKKYIRMALLENLENLFTIVQS
jgi:hypothetical protein